MERISEPKQIDTTQRWKVGLRWGLGSSPLPTKIEFSRRGLDDDVGFASVDPQLIRAYQLPPLMVSHYAPAPSSPVSAPPGGARWCRAHSNALSAGRVRADVLREAHPVRSCGGV